MPELPEVETTRRGISPYLVGQRISAIIVREPRLRWPVPTDLASRFAGETVENIDRRAKYLLMGTRAGSMIIHLGMSGRLQVVPADHAPGKHDHVDVVMDSGHALRFRDPRRFGSLLFSATPMTHPLLASLGPEPLGEHFDGDYLYQASRGRRVAIKAFIMDAKVVVGVGNIYASEALYLAGIHPLRPARRISQARMRTLAGSIRTVLSRAIDAGGTTLRDFFGGDGSPGYFAQQLNVYGRTGQPCHGCGGQIRQRVIGQRSTFYCITCQT